MSQPMQRDVKEAFWTVHNKVVELILFRATKEWSEEWLSSVVSELTNSYRLNTIQDIVPFFNCLARYVHNLSCHDYAYLTIGDIQNLIEEAISDLETAIWETAHEKLCEREGPPKE